MAYSISDFITNAEAGNPIKVTSISPNSDVVFHVARDTVILSEKYQIKTVDGNENVAPQTRTISDIRVIDLGVYFSADDVLRSRDLRQAIIDGTVEADAGTVSLSRVPVV